jgi:hypothetical protein
MNLESLFKFAELENPHANIHEMMLIVNRLAKQNYPDDYRTPFSSIDLANARFTVYMQNTCNEREKALVIVQTLLCKVYSTWHTDVQVLNQVLSPRLEFDTRMIMNALKLLGIPELITDGLNKKTLKLLKKVINDTSRN